jgi:hypothetical protein
VQSRFFAAWHGFIERKRQLASTEERVANARSLRVISLW